MVVLRTLTVRVHKRQQGFTYLAVLFAIALVGIWLSAVGEIWSTTARRQRLQQLDWVGEQYRQAIGSYYESSPGGAKRYPPSLRDLLEDPRFLVVRRHLRRIYLDPLTDHDDWRLVPAGDGGIEGVEVAVPGSATRAYVYVPMVTSGAGTR